jgi:hypothetical protein
MINLDDNVQETAFVLKNGSKQSFFKDIHGLFMLFSWGFLADIGVILVRHFKVHKNYIKFHYNVFKFVDVFTIVFSLLIYLKWDGNELYHSHKSKELF